MPRGPGLDAKVSARGTPGFSGADLANLVNEAALLAARANKRVVTMADFESAKDKVMMGAERRRSEEHTSGLQSLMRISYAVFCLKKKKDTERKTRNTNNTCNYYKTTRQYTTI